jgi:hypothetical protein
VKDPKAPPPVEEEEFVDLEPDPELFGTDDLIGIDELAVIPTTSSSEPQRRSEHEQSDGRTRARLLQVWCRRLWQAMGEAPAAASAIGRCSARRRSARHVARRAPRRQAGHVEGVALPASFPGARSHELRRHQQLNEGVALNFHLHAGRR